MEEVEGEVSMVLDLENSDIMPQIARVNQVAVGTSGPVRAL